MRPTAWLVHHLLEHSAEERPDAPFLIHEGRPHGYAEIDAAANRLARLLRRHGLVRGDRVGLLAHNGVTYVVAWYAILKAGGIAVPLNTAADGATLRGMLADCTARFLVTGRGFERVVTDAVAALPDLDVLVAPAPERIDPLPAHIEGVPLDAADHESSEPLDVALIDLDLAAIIYTSGSTGRPRGATLSHLNIMTNTRSILGYLGLGPDDRVLQVLPFYYVYGKSLLNTHAAVGGTVVIENRFMFPNTALDTLENERCTGLSGVPSTFAILLNRSNFAERRLEHLRYVTQAGGGMSPELTRRLIAALPGRRIFVMYGATEASARLTWLDPDVLPRKIGSIGRPIPNVRVRVLREDGSEVPPGETGELVASGSNIMRGYWNDAEETARVLDEHGYWTGDLGRVDEDGYLWVVGRKKDMIKAGAHRISAKEIEDVILEYPEVHEAAVIGVPHELLGETIRAYVVFRDPPAAAADDPRREELAEFLKRRLPAFKRPERIEVRLDLPKNESGKIMKQVLREQARTTATESPDAPSA
ncbi:MAG: AMP-dependent synthetase [Acidobacteria bacterium]|nr:MAG: AMP-dependent synthetase [Acidobacteriota bacterium]